MVAAADWDFALHHLSGYLTVLRPTAERKRDSGSPVSFPEGSAADGEPVYTLWGVGFYSPHMPAFATLAPTVPAGLWSTGQIAPVEPVPEADDQVRIRIGPWSPRLFCAPLAVRHLANRA